MRSLALTLFLIVAVFIGSTHASAFTHQHDEAAHFTQMADHHGDESDAGHDPLPADSDDPGQITHSHCAMGSIPGPCAVGEPLSEVRVPAPPLVVTAMSSLGIPPPLEPPSA